MRQSQGDIVFLSAGKSAVGAWHQNLIGESLGIGIEELDVKKPEQYNPNIFVPEPIPEDRELNPSFEHKRNR